MTDLTRLTASELSELYGSGSVSPVDLAQQVLAKIEIINPKINALCYTDPETTLAQARASETRWQQGTPRSRLDGIPIAVKDSILTQGWPTLHGSKSTDPDQAWSEDAPVIAKLRQAGIILVGKTAMSEFGSKITTDSLLNGITRNPWNFKYTSGGSSGGSAAAVAAGVVPIALGTDYTGSVRIPASFCGTVGLKPSYGAIPHDTISLFECSCVGPIARSAGDISLMLNVTADTVDISKLRIAYCPDFGFAKNINNEIALAVKQVAEALAQSGAQVTTVSALCDDPAYIIGNMYIIDSFNRWSQLSDYQKQLTGAVYQYQCASIDGSNLTELIKQTKSQQSKLKQKLQEFMKSYDIILSPATTVTADAFLADDVESTHSHGMGVMKHIPFLSLFNITHQPAVTVPVGLNQLGMPMGVQLAGAVGADSQLLQVAQIIEKQFPMPACPVIL